MARDDDIDDERLGPEGLKCKKEFATPGKDTAKRNASAR
jgi:hypothetical protein